MKIIIVFFVVYVSLTTAYSQTAGEHFLSGNKNMKLQNYKEAVTDYTKAIEINPNYAIAYSERGFSKHFSNDIKGAIVDYTKSIEIDPKYYTYVWRGAAKERLEDYRGAMNDYNKAIEIDPNEDSAYFNRANVKGIRQDYRGAIADYTKAIEIAPNGYAYCYRGKSKIKLGQIDSGCLDLSKAGELGAEEAYDLIKEHCN